MHHVELYRLQQTATWAALHKPDSLHIGPTETTQQQSLPLRRQGSPLHVKEVERAAAAVLQGRCARQHQALVRAEAAVGFGVVGGQVAESVQRCFELPSVPELQAAAAGEWWTAQSDNSSLTRSKLCACDMLLSALRCRPILDAPQLAGSQLQE